MMQAEIGFTVRTPMFSSAYTDGPAEFRTPALRGAARYWFRVLAAPVFGDDFSAVAKAEAEVFGAAAAEFGESGRARGPSPVGFRPIMLPAPTREREPRWLRLRSGEQFNGIGYLLGPGLYQPPSPKEGREHPGIQRPSYLAPDSGGTFAVWAVSRDSRLETYCAEVIGIALWAVASFGGLGARTHRGFGGLSFGGLDQLSPVLAQHNQPVYDHPAIRRLHELVAERWNREPPAQCQPTVLGSSAEYPAAPTWSRWHVRASRQQGSWVQLLHAAGRALRGFRAPVDRTAAPYDMTGLPLWKQHVTREYVETVVPALRGEQASARFDIGAFGLPVVFGDHGTVNLRDRQNGAELRRASPLWIRPQPRERSFELLYHVFEAQIGPGDADLGLALTRRGTTITLQLKEQQAYQMIARFLHTAAP